MYVGGIYEGSISFNYSADGGMLWDQLTGSAKQVARDLQTYYGYTATQIQAVLSSLQWNYGQVVASINSLGIYGQQFVDAMTNLFHTGHEHIWNGVLALDVSGASTTPGAQVIQWWFNGNNNQKWMEVPVGDGSVEIVHVPGPVALWPWIRWRLFSEVMASALHDVRLERGDDGVLVVRWATDDEVQVTVDVGLGESPHASEHTRFGQPTTLTAVRLDGVGSGRTYVSLTPAGGAPVVVGERRVPFAGITNLRDLGGYATAGEGTTKWGRVFRADALHKLTDADLAVFHSLGVHRVYDLRGEVERADFPGPFDSVHMPIVGRPIDAPPAAPSTVVSAEDGERMLRDMYVGILEHSATGIGMILRGIADSDPEPTVFHCHGGKDRTGVVAAVLLLALGVDRDTVLDDYEATRRYRRIDDQQDSLANLLASGVSPEAAVGVLGTPRWAMAAAIEAIDDVYGGIDAYLTGPAGLTFAELSALREQLVDSSSRA